MSLPILLHFGTLKQWRTQAVSDLPITQLL